MSAVWISDAELADLLGRETTRVLTRILGGQRVYVPARASEGHRIARAVGMAGMRALCAAYGGLLISLPNGREKDTARKRAFALLREGRSLSQVADACDITQRYAEMLSRELREMESAPGQGRLLE